jgi:phosphatidylinositol 4-kinase
MLTPHVRVLKFLSSHFNATRLGSPHTEMAFMKVLNSTLEGLKHSTGHPLAREVRFQIVIFGLRLLRFVTHLDLPSRYRLKDQILTTALSWFTFAPRWSFGGNRLQLKAETSLLADVSTALQGVSLSTPKSATLLKSVQAKEVLLQTLIESEQARLSVWLYPLNDGRAIHSPQNNPKAPAEVCILSVD